MKKLFTLATGLTLATMALAFQPGSAAAATDCTDQYLLCVNDAVQKDAIYDEMASIECGAEWLGCTIGKLKFW